MQQTEGKWRYTWTDYSVPEHNRPIHFRRNKEVWTNEFEITRLERGGSGSGFDVMGDFTEKLEEYGLFEQFLSGWLVGITRYLHRKQRRAI